MLNKPTFKVNITDVINNQPKSIHLIFDDMKDKSKTFTCESELKVLTKLYIPKNNPLQNINK